MLIRIAGFLFVAIGLLANPWVVERFAHPSDGNISTESRLVIFCFEAICLLIGVFLLASEAVRKRILFSFGMLLLILVAVEIGLHIIFNIPSPEGRHDPSIEIYLAPPLKDKPWAKDVHSEYVNMTTHFTPYVGFQLDEHHGPYINIDANGERTTWNPSVGPGERRKKIYVFGASTILGFGARDDYTISSQLSKLLHRNGYHFEVRNFGMSGTTFTTEIFKLVALLRAGHRPDYVIFYDGANDVVAGYSGNPRELGKYKTIFHQDMPNYTKLLFRVGLTGIIRENFLTLRALSVVKAKWKDLTTRRQEKNLSGDILDQQGTEVGRISKDIIDYYLESKDLLDHLSAVYGFQLLCFWQPNAFLVKNISPDDQKTAAPWAKDLFHVRLHHQTSDALKAMPISNFVNISDVFDNLKKPVFLDWCHIAEEGNAIVANEIFKIMKEKSLEQ